MTPRVLPREEWYRLPDAESAAIAHQLPPSAQVLVVEDDGQIVGSWMLLLVPHVECLWVAPSHRKRGGVFRRLLAGMRRLAPATRVVTASVSPEVDALLMRYGAEPLPGTSWVFAFKERE